MSNLLRSVREVKACEKHLGYALYRAVVDSCDACLCLVQKFYGEQAIQIMHDVVAQGEPCYLSAPLAIRRAFGETE